LAVSAAGAGAGAAAGASAAGADWAMADWLTPATAPVSSTRLAAYANFFRPGEGDGSGQTAYPYHQSGKSIS